jgi:formamidase
MSGLGGLNKSPDGVVLGLVQLQLPNVATPDDLAVQTQRICDLVGKARRNLPTMDLVVFPEYALHGLSMDTNPDIMCRLDGPEVQAFQKACQDNKIWGCFSIMEFNPQGNPYNSGIIIDDKGELKLYYRKLHPWVPVEPWEPGNLGIPVCEGPNGSTLALIICHDGCSRKWRGSVPIRVQTLCSAPQAILHQFVIVGRLPIKPMPSAI